MDGFQEFKEFVEIEEIQQINKKKNPKIGKISKAELRLTEVLKNHFPIKTQLRLNHSQIYHYYYDIYLENKIIEYNGDFWHANPKKYKADQFVKLPRTQKLASEIWKKDKHKKIVAMNHGYQILTIWESDFKKYPEQTIQNCLNFLTQ